MTQVVAAVVLAATVIGGSLLVGRARRRRAPEPMGVIGTIPSHVPPEVLHDPEQVGWRKSAVVVFTEATCATCAAALAGARAAAGLNRAVVEVEYGAYRDLHAQLGIDAVPTTVVVQPSGTVTAGFIGRVGAEDLAQALADADGSPSA